MSKRVFSGARPTGKQHLGNYLGAIRNYVALQEQGYETIYCVVDLHAMTTSFENLRELTAEMVLDWLAAGVDPQKSILFVQSSVPEVIELAWYFSTITPLGWLLRLPTFKEKVRAQPDNVNYGLVGYPVLMAADITLYKAEIVPVGVDQAPHLEFTREVVRRFNHLFGPVLVEPQALYTDFPKVLGIDGVNKMSKSLNNHIEISASPEEIHQRVMMMVTDPQRTHRHIPGRPEVCNVFSFHKFFSPNDVERIDKECRTAEIGCVDCKKILASNISDYFAPFRERREEMSSNPYYIWDVLEDGRRRAKIIAERTMTEVREAIYSKKPSGG